MASPDRRSVVTRQLILTTAERLYAEHGIHAVSNRQISEAAGQGNNAAVAYHFGSKRALLEQIIRRHHAPIEQRRAQLVEAAEGSDELRDWLDCLVHPLMTHLEQLGTPSWYARFTVQAVADPTLHTLLASELATPLYRRVTANIHRCLPEQPPEVRAERGGITRNALLHSCADRERALAEGTPTPRLTWHDAATGLVDALLGLWTAPVTEP